MSSRIAALLPLAFVLASTAPAQAPVVPADVCDNIRARVDAGENMSIIVGMVDASGTSTFGYGRLSAERPQTPDENTVFEIGSITKAFTGILLAEMASRGDVSIDDPARQYLPADVAMPEGKTSPVTLVHLATHTSGLPRLPDNMPFGNPENPYADYTVRMMYDFLAGHTPSREPGAQYEYSNFGAGLLGHVLALRAEKPYERLLKERVLAPLGLGDTTITLREDLKARLAPGHAGQTPAGNWDLPALAGAGALRSTVHDLLLFLAANLGLRETALLPVLEQTHEARVDTGIAGLQVGLGWHLWTPSGAPQIVWHNGGTGGYHSFIGMDKAARRGVVVLTNSNADIDDIGLHLLDPSRPLKVK